MNKTDAKTLAGNFRVRERSPGPAGWPKRRETFSGRFLILFFVRKFFFFSNFFPNCKVFRVFFFYRPFARSRKHPRATYPCYLAWDCKRFGLLLTNFLGRCQFVFSWLFGERRTHRYFIAGEKTPRCSASAVSSGETNGVWADAFDQSSGRVLTNFPRFFPSVMISLVPLRVLFSLISFSNSAPVMPLLVSSCQNSKRRNLFSFFVTGVSCCGNNE